MIWVAVAIVAVFLLWKFTRITLIITGCCVALAMLAGAAAYFIDMRQSKIAREEASKIAADIFVKDDRCTQPGYPVWVSAVNLNDFSVDAISLHITATQRGHSSELYSDYLTQDRILKKGEGYGSCWSLSQYKLTDGKISGFLPSELEWRVSVSYITKTKNP